MEHEEKEIVIKRKIWVKFGEDKNWHISKSSGFYPDVDTWTPEELRIFLKANSDVEPVLMY